MGEATYYLRARFPSGDEAARILDVFKAALARLYELKERWQAIRHQFDRSCAQRRTELAAAFRDLDDMVPWESIDKDCRSFSGDLSMNCLAGPLPDITEEPRVAVDDDEIRLSDLVWHFTSWDGIAEWLRRHGAIAVGWISDEYADPYWDCIPMEAFRCGDDRPAGSSSETA